MSATTISHRSNTTAVHRPALDILVEKLARRLLAWSEARADREAIAQPDHDRIALILQNDALLFRGGSPLGR